MIFPTLKHGGPIDLNALVQWWLDERGGPSRNNPRLQPDTCEALILHHQAFHAPETEFSYDGWRENRRLLWDTMGLITTNGDISLGAEYSAFAGTLVAATKAARVLCVGDDSRRVGGLGHYVALELRDSNVLVYARITGISCKPRDVLLPGQYFAEVAGHTENGELWPHVYVMLLTPEGWHKQSSIPGVLRGYCEVDEERTFENQFLCPYGYVMAGTSAAAVLV